MDVSGYALVVGAGSGIGLETALTFVEKGARGVAFADLNAEAASAAASKSKALAAAPDYKALALRVDVTSRQSVKSLITTVVAEFGRIDYAVNSAGVPRQTESAVPEVDEAEYDQLQDVNAKGILHCLQEEIPVMRAQEHLSVSGRSGKRSLGPGCIINITSLSGLTPMANSVTYAASKFAARGIIKCAAIENVHSGLRINEVCPGFTDTPMLQKGIHKDERVANLVKQRMPWGRVALVEEIAGVVHFLASPAASFVNGQSWVVDSGASVRNLP